MAKILCLVPDLRHGSAATRLHQIVSGFGQAEHHFQIVAIRQGGHAILHTFDSQARTIILADGARWNLGGLIALRRLVAKDAPDLVQVWGLPALRRLFLAVGKPACPVLLHEPFRPGRGRGVSFLDRRLMRACQAVAVPDRLQAVSCLQAGLSPTQVEVIPPAVSAPAESTGREPPPEAERQPIIVCLGPLERHKGYYEAIWAFDMLRHLHPELRLWVVGDGPDHARLRRFAGVLSINSVVRFWGDCHNPAPLLAQAAAVWVPSLTDAGRHAVLEGMAAGRPVVASAVPALSELISSGRNGILVPPADKLAFARKTKALLDCREHAEQLGAQGRDTAFKSYSCGQLLERYRSLYGRLARAA